jgi:glycosyltransferase involved in cell wall biosynthesis
MKVLIVNTSERNGGAAVAAKRLMKALNNNGVKAQMLVRDKETDDISVVGLSGGMRSQWYFLWERMCLFARLHFSRKHLFEIDLANAGHDITTLSAFQEADIIHLHWINQGMLSLGSIKKILASGKPVVWTMHDIWPATGICHLTLGCRAYTNGCRHCKYLPGKGSSNDLSTKIWRRKQQLYNGQSIRFVACSKWLAGEAGKSELLRNQKLVSIPNPIDTRVFCPKDPIKAREALGLPTDKRLILFVSQRITNVNKGIQYLIDACTKMVEEYPDSREQTGIVVLGGHAEEVADKFPYPVYPLGYVSDPQKIVEVYNAADLFVMPSLSENLPNTIMESMACGVPCVGFKVGGIPEMIDHRKNGYVAEYRNNDDLARGIHWVLYEADKEALSHEAIRKVARAYSQQAVALRYSELYTEALAHQHYHL